MKQKISSEICLQSEDKQHFLGECRYGEPQGKIRACLTSHCIGGDPRARGGLEMVWVLHSRDLFCLHRLCLRISMPSLFQELTSPASSKAPVPLHLHRLDSYISSHLSAPWSHSLNTHHHSLYIGRPRLLLSWTPSVSPTFHVDTLLSAHMPASSRLNTSPHLSGNF